MTQLMVATHLFEFAGCVVGIFHADKGKGLPQHQHRFDHITFCCSGSCIVRNNRRELIMTKDTQPILLVANEWHEIESLEDGTVFCNVFSESKL